MCVNLSLSLSLSLSGISQVFTGVLVPFYKDRIVACGTIRTKIIIQWNLHIADTCGTTALFLSIVERSPLHRDVIVFHALSQYFTYQEHCKNTRNNRYSVCLPQIRTEYARKGFFYMGAKTFNELLLTARMSDNVLAFREIMDNIYV